MTVGISSIALANDIKLDEDFVSCNYTTTVMLKKCNGNLVEIYKSPAVIGECGDNEEGSVVIVRKTVTEECGPVGPITDIN